MGKRRFEKGFLTSSRLPVSGRYVRAPGRGWLYLIGAVIAVLASAAFLADAFVGRATAISNAPLSENHALFARDCSTCHTPGEGVSNAKCLNCHEAIGEQQGAYSFDRHYLYHSQDFDRSAPRSSEVSCASCHTEHRGREASLRRVADASCRSCHDFGTFADGHPEFEFATSERPDPANLRFPHTLHVRELVEVEELESLESACLHCHERTADGRGFRPISFERSCDACHLTRSGTPFLPLRQAGEPGVVTLDEIRRTGGAASLWADYWDPNEFRTGGGQIQKRPVYHEDPWILENLRRLRGELYPGAELADLLRASAEIPSGPPATLHQEAVATLRDRVRALRGQPSPDVQDELDRLEDLLAEVDRRLEDPYAVLDVTQFDVGIADRAPELAAGDVDSSAYGAVIDSLTASCQDCHLVERATFRRVQADQRTLIRSEFDHEAHVIHRDCLDCHTEIPIDEYAAAPEDVPAGADHAGIQNLPRIANCRSCHSSAGPADRCTSCHLFHPDGFRHADLSTVAQRP